MASLHDQLVHALDRDSGHGWFPGFGGDPVDAAIKVARGRGEEAMRETEAILADSAASSRTRRHAVALLARLGVQTADVPSAEEIYRANASGTPFDPHAKVKQALLALTDDRDDEVRVAAAVELLKLANPPELPALRTRLAPLAPLLRERRAGSPFVQQALVALGGADETVARLAELADGTGALPPDLETLVLALTQDPDPRAAPLLARLFPRLDAITERHDPQQITLGGTISAWDGETTQALVVLKAYIEVAAPVEVAGAVELLRAGTERMGAALVFELADLAERGVVVAGAAAADVTLPPLVRIAATRTLGKLAREQPPAIERLQRLVSDEVVGKWATKLLAGTGGARS